MSNELAFWKFIAERLHRYDSIMLLVVAESTGSSPGRAGYKMAVAADGELCGSIGGGVMEVALVERARQLLSSDPASPASVVTQEHRKKSKHPSGMICSGSQTVILKRLTLDDLPSVEYIAESLVDGGGLMIMTGSSLGAGPDFCGTRKMSPNHTGSIGFERRGEDFVYSEELGRRQQLIVVGGGHCALALSEMMANMNFRISIFDDRPELNTIAKNSFADSVTIIDSYENIVEHLPDYYDLFVVVMTLGYASDAVVIRRLVDIDANVDLKYLGVLGSKAKMAILMQELRDEGYDKTKLARIHAPVGLPINSHTPHEIAVSIAAEIIQIKNNK